MKPVNGQKKLPKNSLTIRSEFDIRVNRTHYKNQVWFIKKSTFFK